MDSGLIPEDLSSSASKFLVSILISVDSGLILQSHQLLVHACSVSILISVDSGLILFSLGLHTSHLRCFNPYFSGFRSYTSHPRAFAQSGSCFNPYFSGFRSYTPIIIILGFCPPSFNPYFSGFRSYTDVYGKTWNKKRLVSILISVDSGLIRSKVDQQLKKETWVSILISVDSGLIPLVPLFFNNSLDSFNPYFSGFRSYTAIGLYLTLKPLVVSILISVDSGLIPENIHTVGCNSPLFQSLFQWIPVLYRS